MASRRVVNMHGIYSSIKDRNMMIYYALLYVYTHIYTCVASIKVYDHVKLYIYLSIYLSIYLHIHMCTYLHVYSYQSMFGYIHIYMKRYASFSVQSNPRPSWWVPPSASCRQHLWPRLAKSGTWKVLVDLPSSKPP